MNVQGFWLMAWLAGNLMAQALPTSGAPADPKAPGTPPALEQLERDYAADKITARQFQWYLTEHKSFYVKPRPAGSPAAPVPAAPVLVPAIPVPATKLPEPARPQAQRVQRVEANPPPNPPPPTSPAPVPAAAILPPATPVPAAPAVTSARLPGLPLTNTLITNITAALIPPISDEERDPAIRNIEVKVDELLKLKAERDQAARLNALVSTNTLGKLKSKRQRLNELIRLHVNGALSDQDYKAKRDAVIAEPEN